ncbi:MAG: HD domain-containing phosphohydrolase [Bacillota bacterium]|nr:HD domain-containing phosphohydrolase [Bacillota bacterium]
MRYTQEIAEQVETLLNIGIALSAEKDHNRLLEMIVTEARRITNADAGTLYLCEKNKLTFRIMQNETMNTFKGGHGEIIDIPPVPIRKENVSGYTALTRQNVNIPDVYQTEAFDFSGPRKFDETTGYKTLSMLVVPLQNHENRVIGVLQLINARDIKGNPIPFAQYFEKVITSLASQAAIALCNMQLIEDIEQLFNSFVEVMATAIDSRTPYNAHHTRRVALLAGELAQVIDESSDARWKDTFFDQNRKQQLVVAGWMHDIGKISTPLAVMNKATRIESQLELIMQRFDYIASYLESQYLTKQITFIQNGAADELALLEKEYNEQMDFLENSRALIIRVDNPSTFVDKELLAEIQNIASQTYEDRKGIANNWLTPDELTALSVTKGTLTEEERKIMENHVIVTQLLLDKIPFTEKLKNVPLFASIHHEHLNGNGYPLGLTAEDIPLEGRILALVDVFDALTAEDRPYKKAMPLEQALKILGFMVKDGELDPDLVKLFIAEKVWERID